jgi:stage II sporulation protein M
MRVNRVSDGLGTHFQNNFWLYVVSLMCLCTGIVLGIYTVKYMGDFEKTDLINYFMNFTNSVNSVDINHKYIFFETLKNNIPILIILWLLGLTVVGIPVILIINVIKGFTVGFTLSFIISGMGIQGIWLAALGVLPQNIIYIPCIIFASVLGMELSLNKLKDKVNKHMSPYNPSRTISYSVTFIIIILIMFLGFFLEAYVSPNIIKTIVMGVSFWI